MSKLVNYWKCDYCGDEHEITNTNNRPCNHPENIDKDCPLQNKEPNQLDVCQLLNK